MLAQHCINVIQMFCVCWVLSESVRTWTDNAMETGKRQSGEMQP